MRRSALMLAALIVLAWTGRTSASEVRAFLVVPPVRLDSATSVQPTSLREGAIVALGDEVRAEAGGMAVLVEYTGRCLSMTVIPSQQKYRVTSDAGTQCRESDPHAALRRAMAGDGPVSKVLFKAVFLDAGPRGDSGPPRYGSGDLKADDFLGRLGALRPTPGQIRPRYSAVSCLHKKADNWKNGNRILIRSCAEGGSQMKSWAYDFRTGLIRAAKNGAKCWHMKYNNWDDGNPIHLWDCAAGSNHMKTWIYDGETGQIRARSNPAMCIHKKDGGFANGNPVHLWACNQGRAAFKSWSMY